MLAQSFLGMPEAEPAKPSAETVFSGIPSFVSGEAVLFDSTRPQDAGKIPDQATISQLELRFPDGAPKPDKVDGGLCLLIFVDDAASPRAKVRLVDLIRQGIRRPLNLLRQAGQVVRIVLLDPAGAWASNTPRIEVALEW
jgi:Ca-activated chloride channel family protein